MITLSNHLLLSLSIDNTDMPIEAMGCPYIQMDTAGGMLGVPILTMIMYDHTNLFFDKRPVMADMLVVVGLGLTEDSMTYYEYRVTRVISDGDSVFIRGALNCPKLIKETTFKAIKASASDCLQTIAETVGLGYDGVPTGDSMVWVPMGKRWLQFARYVARYAYVTDGIMAARIDSIGRLRLRNLNAPHKSVAPLGYTEGNIPLLEFLPDNLGTADIFGGLKSSLHLQDSNGVKSVVESMSLAQKVLKLNQHSRMSAYITNGNHDIAPIVYKGNVHDNFFTASYNNERGLQVNNVTACAVISWRTTIEALDWITLNMTNRVEASDEGRASLLYNGDWWVDSKSIFVESGHYFESFPLRRTGTDLPFIEEV